MNGEARAEDPARQHACTDDVCVTCSDEANPYTVLELFDAGMATVDTEAGREEISVALVSAEVGDTVLVHAGEAIAVIKSNDQNRPGWE